MIAALDEEKQLASLGPVGVRGGGKLDATISNDAGYFASQLMSLPPQPSQSPLVSQSD